MVSSIDTIIFDLFRTLMYIPERTNPYARFVKEHVTSVETIPSLRRICFTEDLLTLAAVAERLWPNKQINASQYDNEVLKEVASCRLYTETLDVLAQLTQQKIKIGLISNLATPYKEPFFKLGLSAFIQKPIFSCDVGIIKPEKEIYLLALESLGAVPQQVLMVGDSYANDVLGPSVIGMRGVLLDRNNSSDYKEKISNLSGIFDYISII